MNLVVRTKVVAHTIILKRRPITHFTMLGAHMVWFVSQVVGFQLHMIETVCVATIILEGACWAHD